MNTSVPLSMEITLRAISPRNDKDRILAIISKALDACDPDERPSIQFTRWP